MSGHGSQTPLLLFVTCMSLVGLSGCGPSELAKKAAVADFCAAPKPLPWAPDTKEMVLYAKNVRAGMAAPSWIHNDYYLPAELGPRGPFAGRIACLVIDNDILEKRMYVSTSGTPREFERTRARTTLRVYQAKTGQLLVEDRATGPDPMAFESSVSDIARYRGDADLTSIQRVLRAAHN